MLKLRAGDLQIYNQERLQRTLVLRVSRDNDLAPPLREKVMFVGKELPTSGGFAAYGIFNKRFSVTEASRTEGPIVELPEDLEYLAKDDVISLNPFQKSISSLIRAQSKHNSLLLTERCNHYCLMCSQPPKSAQDDWIVDEVLEAIKLAPRTMASIGITGGEPTLLGDRFFSVLRMLKNYLPETHVHVLTNGRAFSRKSFVDELVRQRHGNIILGIPMYSDIPEIHNYIVQAENAFDEAVRGILNLKAASQRVEIRVVIHKQNYERLGQLAEFIARNLTMVDHVALMGLEIIGFTRANLEELWIDPWEYRDHLADAVDTLNSARMNVSIFNHQLCLLPEHLWGFAQQAISDWKNEYEPECVECLARDQCGGFFFSARYRKSSYIKPVGEPRGAVDKQGVGWTN